MVGGQTDQFVQVTERVFVSMDGTLYFSYNRKMDATSYACTLASSSVRSGQYGPFFNLILPQNGEASAFPPRIDEYQPQVFPEYPILGQTIFIECFAYGFPAPKYKWTRVDGKVFSQRHKMTNFGRVLKIENVEQEDSTRYRCTASNDLGMSTAEILLVIQSPPVILHYLVDKLTSTNATVRFACPTVESHNSPHVHIEWFRNSLPIVPVLMDAEERRRFLLEHSELAINNVRPSDSGMYQCRLSNEAGSVSSSAFLAVRDSKPIFHPNVFPRRVFVVEGSELRLPCLFFSMPPASAHWKRLSRKDSEKSAEFEELEESGISMLRIGSFSPKDVGDYECLAENEHGQGRGVVQLALMSKQKVSISQSVRPDQDGYGLRLSCEAELECASPNACPEAHFDWQFNEQSAQRLSGAGRLRMRQYARSVEDKKSNKIRQHAEIDASSSFVTKNFGRFACSSVFGGASAELEPYNQGAIALSAMAPTHVKVLGVDMNSVKLSWRLPPAQKRHESAKALKVDGYLVEHRTSDDRTWRPLSEDPFLTSDRIIGSFLLRNLHPNTKYQFRIRTRSSDGAVSLPSSATPWVTTPPAAPDDTVKNLRWKVLDSSHLLLEWDPIERGHQSGPNLRYNVTWSADHDTLHYGVVERPNHVITLKKQTNKTPTRKTTCQVFVVGVQPLNDLGIGPAATDTVVYVTEQPPKRVATNLRLSTHNATHLNMTWDWTNTDECENIRGAQINCVDDWDETGPELEVGPDNASINISIPPLVSSWLLGGLQAWTNYHCSIGAYDQLGRRGPQSRTKMARTAEPAPSDAPEIIKVKLHETLTGYTTLIDWTPVRLNTALNSTKDQRGYRVYVYISETAEQPVVLELLESELQDARRPMARIDGLKLMYYYRIQVAGFNRGGTGPLSAPTSLRIGSSETSIATTADFQRNVWLTVGLFLLLRIL